MEKNEYLKENKKFIDYLNEYVTGSKPLRHEYTVVWNPWKKWMRERAPSAQANDYCWRVNTLEEAFKNYFWPPGSYRENVKELETLSTSLKKAEDDKSLFYQCIGVLIWGKVANKGSINWLFEMVRAGTLRSSLNSGVELLDGESEEGVKAAFRKDGGNLLMNSGLTKIYSLMSDGSIIYDGRVGAALCLMIRRYLDENDISEVPDALSFQWGEDQGRKNKGQSKRDPSVEGCYEFRKLSNISHEHAVLNLRANWIFEAVLPEGGLWGFKEKMEKLRALETAMFMIGADVKGTMRP